MRVLLAEDDASLGTTLQSWLQLDGYAVDWVRHGEQADSALLTGHYDCILLDRGLPGRSGDVLLRTLRTQGKTTPVIMITARDGLRDRIDGLDMGADDYLIKPFDLEELSARIRAALRRHSGQPNASVTHGALTVDTHAKRVTHRGQPVELTAREFAVLHALIRRPDHIVSREQLESALYGWGDEVESNAIEVYVYTLRKKLGSDRIVTVRRQGYRMGPCE